MSEKLTADQTAMVTAYADGLSAYSALTADTASLKETLRKGLACLLALRDVEGFSGRDIAALPTTPGVSQVARDLRAAEFIRDFPKMDPADVKKACDLVTAKQIDAARAEKNPPTALMIAAGLKKEERRGPNRKKTDPGSKKKGKKDDGSGEVVTTDRMPAAVEAIVRGFVKAIESGNVDADLVARMRTVLQHGDQLIAGARMPIAETA